MPIPQILWVIALIGTVVLTIKSKSNIPDGQSSQEPLTTIEKFGIWVFCFINPVLTGAIFYYGWRKKLPIKSKQANKISWMAVAIEIIFGGLLLFLSKGR